MKSTSEKNRLLEINKMLKKEALEIQVRSECEFRRINEKIELLDLVIFGVEISSYASINDRLRKSYRSLCR